MRITLTVRTIITLKALSALLPALLPLRAKDQILANAR
jgi:hypothetical protein